MSRPRPLLSRLAVAIGVGAAVLAFAGSGIGSVAAEERGGSGNATADALRLSVSAPGASLSDNVVDLGGPTAQARLDELGGSEGFAAYPYPGDAVLSAGLAAGATGLPIPAYPFAVAASHPATPEAKVERPGYTIEARTAAEEAVASARSGASGETTVGATGVTATVQRRAGVVTSQATATSEFLRLGPLEVTAMRSEASATRAANGELRRTSQFSAQVTVGGSTVRAGNSGFEVAGSAVPIPSGEPLATTLGQAGFTLSYLQPQDTDDGVVSAGLVLQHVRRVEGVGTGVVVTTVTLGRTAAAARRPTERAAGAGELPDVTGDLPSETGELAHRTGEPSSPGPVSEPGGPPTGRYAEMAGAATGAVGFASGNNPDLTRPPAEAALPGSAAADPNGVGSSVPPGSQQVASAGFGPQGPPGRFRSLYPVLAAAGLATVLSQQGLRILVQRGSG